MIEKPDKIMTVEEYVANPLIGWHMICRNCDGHNSVGIKYRPDMQALEREVQSLRDILLTIETYARQGHRETE